MTGLATSVARLDRTSAPRNAPTAPGTPMRRTTFQSTLPNRQCERPDTSVVPISLRWMVAEAAAGLVPMASSRVVDVTPYAMPRAPSTSWAASPTRASRINARTERPPRVREDDHPIIPTDLVYAAAQYHAVRWTAVWWTS